MRSNNNRTKNILAAGSLTGLLLAVLMLFGSVAAFDGTANGNSFFSFGESIEDGAFGSEDGASASEDAHDYNNSYQDGNTYDNDDAYGNSNSYDNDDAYGNDNDDDHVRRGDAFDENA